MSRRVTIDPIDNAGLLLAAMQAFAGSGEISFEGIDDDSGFRDIAGAKRRETGALRSATLSWPVRDFVVIPLTKENVPAIWKLISWFDVDGKSVPDNFIHVQISTANRLVFAAYDEFRPDCIFMTDEFPLESLDQLVAKHVIRSYQIGGHCDPSRSIAGIYRSVPMKRFLVAAHLMFLTGALLFALRWHISLTRCEGNNADISTRNCTGFIHLLDQEIRRDPNDSVAFSNRGAAYWYKGDYDRAIAEYNQAIQLNPNNADAFSNRGAAYRVKGDYDRAIADYNEAIRLKPRFAIAFYDRGLAYRGKGDNDRAIGDFDQAIRFDPNYAPAFTFRGMAYHAKRDYDRAIADYDQAIRLKPDDAFTFTDRGFAYRAQGDNDRAIADYDHAIRLNPKFAQAFYYRGSVYRAKGDNDRAIADYDQAIRLEPSFPQAFNARGYMRFNLGQFSLAARDFARSVVLDPGGAYARLWLHIARARAGVGDVDELAHSAATLDLRKWPGPVLALYLGKLTPEQTRTAAAEDSNVKSAIERSCEAAFYVGEYELLRRNVDGAKKLLQEAVSTCPHEFVEYEGAAAELTR